jgi:proteasome accessory factor A
MSQVSTFLKVGTMALVLRLVEDGALGPVPQPESPVEAFWTFSRDLSLKATVPVRGGGELSALDIQRVYLERVQAYARAHPLPGSFPEVVRRWAAVLDALEADPLSVDRQVDWAIKHHMIDSYLGRKGLGWDSPRAKAMDIQYHDIDPARGLFHTLRAKGWVDELVAPEAVAQAVSQPPEDTRAWFRGQCLARFGKGVYGVSWSSVLLDVGDGIRRIATPNPFRGTRAITGPLFDRCATPRELVAMLERG